jgi:hypothetical protein
MALVPDTGFLARFPEFTAVDEARIQLFLDEALLEIRESEWGDFYYKGLNLFTAHLLAIGNVTSANTGGAIGTFGPLASRGIGDVNASFGISGLSDSENSAWLNSTPYGQELLRLINTIGCDMLVV